MKIFKMPWKQENNDLEQVVIIPKIINYSREDYEHITVEGEDEVIEWKSIPRLTSFFEVYPDIDSYKRRAVPLTVVKDSVNIKEEVNLYVDFAVESLINKQDPIQDFSKGQVDTINFGE